MSANALLGLTYIGSYHSSRNPTALPTLPNRGAAVEALRPRSRVRIIGKIEVKPDGSKDYTTVTAANDAALTMQNAKMAAEGEVFRTPNFTVEVVIHPGTYTHTAAINLNPFVAFISASGIPGDVVMKSNDIATGLGTIVSYGDFYLEGIDFVRAGSATLNGKYCHHIALDDHETGVAVACRFYTETISNAGGWTCTGMDGSPGITLLYYGCEFYSKATGTYAPGGTNLHGLIAGAPSGSVPSDIIFVNCIGGAVGYQALTNAVPDDVWVSGGTYTSVTATGSLTDLHWANATGTMTAAGSVINDLTGMPTVVGGMSARELARYFGTPA